MAYKTVRIKESVMAKINECRHWLDIRHGREITPKSTRAYVVETAVEALHANLKTDGELGFFSGTKIRQMLNERTQANAERVITHLLREIEAGHLPIDEIEAGNYRVARDDDGVIEVRVGDHGVGFVPMTTDEVEAQDAGIAPTSKQ